MMSIYNTRQRKINWIALICNGIIRGTRSFFLLYIMINQLYLELKVFTDEVSRTHQRIKKR